MRNIYILLILIINTHLLFSEDEKEEDSDSTNYKIDIDMDFLGKGAYEKSEMIDVKFGLANSIINQNDIGKHNIAEIFLGYNKIYIEENKAKAGFQSFYGLNFSMIYDHLDEDKKNREFNAYQLAYKSGDRYGYKLSDDFRMNTSFAESRGINFFEYNANEFISHSDSTLGNFVKSALYVENFNSNIGFVYDDFIGVNFDYERSLVNQSYIFWQNMLTGLIIGVSNSALDRFIKKISEKRPYLAPIIYIILKTGLNYGFYELRKEKMNWPLKSAEPIIFDSFKAGLSINF